MTARILDGKAVAARIRKTMAVEVSSLRSKHGRAPGLAVILVGEDAASEVYVRNKKKACVDCGIESEAFS
ncbi:MAG: tetrahydrofolate dehydrogenase/cyclohydrolase catalytic domain-containing protein, partial [Mariprofundaceae bacterium]|nr:tetrahydrofolate dehydrogenase/cyclohydrolase catalytic domain-containing protein [Mariprofundaceae bacterium]